jgi:hypothetical protein
MLAQCRGPARSGRGTHMPSESRLITLDARPEPVRMETG